MEKYRLAYIGEPNIGIDLFRRGISKYELDVVSIKPTVTNFWINNLVVDFDIIVTGFHINSYLHNGAELIEKVNKCFSNFPCFMVTDFYDEAIKTSKGCIHHIYSKSELTKASGTISLGFKLYSQAQKHKKLINKKIKKFSFLSDKIEKDWLTYPEEREWLKLYRWLINSGYEHMKLTEYKKDEIVTGRVIDLIKSNNILSNLIQSGNHKI